MVRDSSLEADLKWLREEMIREIFLGYLREIGLKSNRGGSRDHSKQVEETIRIMYQANLPVLPINTTGYFDEDEESEGMLLPDAKVDIEKMVMKKDGYNRLSPEAKFVVDTVCEGEVTTPNGKTTTAVIRTHLASKKWRDATIARTHDEIREFVKTF
jgi:hypothetical protein